MRTRFLSTDFFNPVPIQTLDFLHFSPPHFPPSSSTSDVEYIRNFFDASFVPASSSEIDQLPIETSLTKFFSDVLPQFLDVRIGDFADDFSSAETPCSPEPRSGSIGHSIEVDASSLEKSEIFSDEEGMANPGYVILQGKDRIYDVEGNTDIKIIHFEAPEVHTSTEMYYYIHGQRMNVKVFSEISQVETEVDMPSFQLKMQDILEIQKSVYSINGISTEYFKEQKADLLEGSSTTGEQLDASSTPFPVFEVDEESLSIFNDISVGNELKPFDDINYGTWLQDHHIPTSDWELLDSKEFDLLVHLSNNCPAERCPTLEITCSSFSQEIDFISACEDADICQILLFHQGISQEVLLRRRNIVLFEEFQFTGVELYDFFEIFWGSGTVFTVKACDTMFSESMKFRSFNDLIVSNELILVDDSFKSLPVPILSESRNIWSLHSLAEKMLSVLEPQSSSTFDGLYLDWYILEEANGSKYYSHWEMLKGMDTHSIDSTLSICDNRMLVLNFLLSSDCFDMPNLLEENEISQILLQRISLPPIPLVEITSQKVGNDDHRMRATEDISSDLGSARSSTSQKNGDPHITSVLTPSNSRMEELLNFMPVEENRKRSPDEASKGEECCVKHVQSVSLDMESEEIHTGRPSPLETVIVVNTRNFDKEMIISRRSAYQKILALEKVGVQVVERDLNLPVDVVVSASICIVWYDLKNIAKRASDSDEAFSCLALCVENIAAGSSLTSLSYAFRCCILIFEGEAKFLAGVVESSHVLYAAASSLGIDFQIFLSYSPTTTDEIVLSCIEAETKLTRGLYPPMPDSETLAESFLTAFPSINPLSAHGILSDGGTLVEFLEMSHDRKMHLARKYRIPDESVALLGILCQYGEREDSKSGMTDSSSSASYAPDRFQKESIPEARKRKHIDALRSVDVNINELSQCESLSLFSDVQWSPPRASGPMEFWISENQIEECKIPALPSDNKVLQQSRKLNANMMMNSSKLPSLSEFEMGEGLSSEGHKKPMKPLNNAYFAGNQMVDMAAWNKTYRHGHESGNQLENYIGEVIDTDTYATFTKDISTLKSLNFLPCDMENHSASGISRTLNIQSFGATNFSTFSTPAEIDSKSNSWISKSRSDYSSRKANKSAPDSCFNNCTLNLEQQQGQLHNDKVQKTTLDSSDQSKQKIDGDHFDGTTLWNAIHSSGYQQLRESPWTIEFLNRIKEKSRARQQSLPHGLSPPCSGSFGNRSNARKRRSPSILEYYKYQEDGVSNRSINHKRQKQSVKPSPSNKKQKAPDSIFPTGTPVDKRAKRTLAFATSGSGGGGQSKLIWSDHSHPFYECKY